MPKLMVDSLTPEQLDLMNTVKQEYIDALTKDFDDNYITKKVKWFYEVYGLRDPHVHIFDSPQQFEYVPDKWPNTSGYPQDYNIDNHLFNIWRQVQSSIGESAIDLVKRQLIHKIHNVYDDHSVLERVIRRVILTGGLDMKMEYNVPLLSLYDYFIRIGAIIDKSENKDIEKFIEYMKTGIRYRLYVPNHAYIIRNNNGPQFKDELGRLNNEKGYAVIWKQDKRGNAESGLHFVKGVYFQPDLFDKIFIKENISGEEIFRLKNTEQKAVAIHHMGYDKFIKELHAEKLDTWTTESVINGNIAICELYQFRLDNAILRFVEVQDHSTGKKTVLGVPIIPDTQTAKGAVAWTFGRKEDEYYPLIET